MFAQLFHNVAFHIEMFCNFRVRYLSCPNGFSDEKSPTVLSFYSDSYYSEPVYMLIFHSKPICRWRSISIMRYSTG